MSQQEQAPTQEQPLSPKEAITNIVDAAYVKEGYVNGDGQRDHAAVAEAIYPLVAKAHVSSPAERAAKAVSRGEVFTTVFPAFPDRAQWSEFDDAELWEEADKEIQKAVWNLLKPDRQGYVQKIVGVRTPGLILCRTKVGVDGVNAVYVTDDLACLKEDFITPLSDTMRRANRRMSLNLAMAGVRLPEHAKAFDRLYRQANKLALNAGLADTQLMLEQANDDDDNGDVAE